MALNEDTLVQQTTADYLRDALGWRSEFAYNTEVLGPEGSCGRKSEQDVVLTRILGEKLIALNDTAAVLLCKLFGRQMAARQEGLIAVRRCDTASHVESRRCTPFPRPDFRHQCRRHRCRAGALR